MRPGRCNKQRGQILLLLTLCFIPLVLMVAYLFNTGEQVARKEKIQNAADSAALSDASYTARALNVMSMDNIAISQTLGMDVIYATLLPTMVNIGVQGAEVTTEDDAETAAACATLPIGLAACLVAGARAADAYVVWAYAGAFVALNLPRTFKLKGHVQGYEALSDDLVTHFPALSRQLESDLAGVNGVAADTRLIMVGATAPTDQDQDYQSTGLPVLRVDVPGGATASKEYLYGVGKRELYNGGLNGTQANPGASDFAWNYQFHGYSGQGPYAIDRDDAFDQAETVVTMAELAGYSPPDPDADSDYADDCWRDVTPVVIVPGGCYKGAPVPIGFADIYAFAPFGTPVGSAGVVDIMALAHYPRSQGPVASPSFTSRPGDMFSLSRARVYNATSADLYSSDWRATLTPVIPNTNGWDPTDLGPSTVPSINTLSGQIAALNDSVTDFTESDWRALLTH
jgi:hypothetical protein